MKSSTSLTLAVALLLAGSLAQAAEPVAPTLQLNAIVRLLKADGSTVIGQVPVSPAGTPMRTIAVRQADAIVAANGRCAFNLRLDEVSNQTLAGTRNQLFSNDALVADLTQVDLQANVLRSLTTQPYLFPGGNNLRVVLNAGSATPVTGWVRIEVDGTCTAAAAKPVTPPVATPPASAPTPAPVKLIVPGSGDWNNLFNAWGYSNYATTQLKNKGYARYADLVKLNAELGAVVGAKKVEQPAYAALMARWAAIANDKDFKALMARVVPSGDRK